MNRYEVIAEVTVKTPKEVIALKPGQVIRLPEQSARQLIEAGKIKPLPHITNFGSLIIPHNSPQKYHWWNRGQSVVNTLKELNASEDIARRYSNN